MRERQTGLLPICGPNSHINKYSHYDTQRHQNHHIDFQFDNYYLVNHLNQLDFDEFRKCNTINQDSVCDNIGNNIYPIYKHKTIALANCSAISYRSNQSSSHPLSMPTGLSPDFILLLSIVSQMMLRLTPVLHFYLENINLQIGTDQGVSVVLVYDWRNYTMLQPSDESFKRNSSTGSLVDSVVVDLNNDRDWPNKLKHFKRWICAFFNS